MRKPPVILLPENSVNLPKCFEELVKELQPFNSQSLWKESVYYKKLMHLYFSIINQTVIKYHNVMLLSLTVKQ